MSQVAFQIIAGCIVFLIVFFANSYRSRIAEAIRRKKIARTRSAYQDFHYQYKNDVIGRFLEPKVTIEIKRPIWDTEKRLTAQQIQKLSDRSQESFENFNEPRRVASPTSARFDARKSGFVAVRSFHSKEKYRAHFVGNTKSGLIVDNASKEVLAWTRNAQSSGHQQRIGFLTGPVSIGKSTVITNVVTELNRSIYKKRRSRSATHSEVLPIYINYNKIHEGLSSDPETLPSTADVAYVIAEAILKSVDQEVASSHRETIATAKQALSINYSRCLVIIDSLDRLYYAVVMKELMEEEEGRNDGNKYEVYLSSLIHGILKEFEFSAEVELVDILVAIRTETLDRIRSLGKTQADDQMLHGVNADFAVELLEVSDRWRTNDRSADMILGRLRLISDVPDLQPTAKDKVNEVIDEIEKNPECLTYLNQGIGYGIGLNENRDLMHKMRCIPWSVYDDRFKRIFFDKNMCLLHYMLNGHLTYTQADNHLLNVFLVWNNDRRLNPVGEYGVRIDNKLLAHHMPTYWLKYIVLKLLNNREALLDKWSIEGILAGEGELKYERHLVRLVLYSLQEVTHGRFVKRGIDPATGRAYCLKLTERGERFLENNVSFDFIYLLLVSADRVLAKPSCYDFNNWHPVVANARFLYSASNEKFNQEFRKYVYENVPRVFAFLRLLEVAAKWEQRQYSNTFKELREKYKVELPNMQSIRKNVEGQVIDLYVSKNGKLNEIKTVIRKANILAYKKSFALESWYSSVYGRFWRVSGMSLDTGSDIANVKG